MRIERLTFQAFGPYVERQELNLADLAKHRLFLIRGATGAGKTIILDAITYALYGKSSGGERGDLESMRSRSAPNTLPTTIELICVIRDKRYRFYREVKVGKKRSGESFLKVSVTGGELRDGEFYPFFENGTASALEKQAEQLIGFTHAQFIRTVMLPQGKFERLLVSSSAEKQDILKTLFQSERWSLLCDTLSEQLKTEKTALERLHQQRSDLLVQGNAASWEELCERSQQLDEQKQAEQCAMQEAKAQWDAQRQKYEEQMTLHQYAQRLAASRQQLSALEKQKDTIEAMRKQRQIAEAYQRVLPYVRSWQEETEALHKLTQHKQKLYLAKQECEAEWKQLQAQQKEWEHKESEKQRIQQQLAQWEEQWEHWQQRREGEARLGVYQKQHDQMMDELKNLDQQIETVNRQEQRYREVSEQWELKQKDYLTWLKEEQLWQERATAQAIQQQYEQQLCDWQNQIAAHNKALVQAEAAEKAAQTVHEQLYQDYLKNSAALFASLLKDGEPCPVCGSRVHPYHQEVQVQMVENRRLLEAKANWEKCREKTHLHQTWLNQAAQHIKELQEQLNRQKDQVKALGVPYSSAAHQQLKQQIHALQQEQKQQTQAKSILDQSLIQRQKWIEEKTQLQEKIQKCRQQYTILKTQLQERFVQIAMDEADLRTKIRQNQDMLATMQKEYDTWKTAYEHIQIELAKNQSAYQYDEERCKRQQEKVRQCQAKIDRENHDGLDLYQTFPDPNEIARMKEQITAYEQAFERNQGAIHEWEEQLKGKELADIQMLERQCTESENAYRQHFQRQLEREKQYEMMKDVQKRYQKVQERYEAAVLRYSQRSEFVKALRGDTGIGIERYVLGIMLSQITQTANALLTHVHDGRYAIYRSDEATGRKRKAGLELSVYDRQSGSLRSVFSLSGGEKFLVSLALSLALSTVVQARSGGVVMETMFIDEGFGSLDVQSIADALELLQQMTEGKGWIAIISHVELLKENIPYGIEVSKQKEGSSCRMLV